MTGGPALTNRPRLSEDARFATRDLLREFEQRKVEILQSARSFTKVPSRAAAGDVGDVIGIAKTVLERLESRRDELIEPYREAAGVVRREVEGFWSEITEEMDRLQALVDAFRQAEEDRIRQQQLEQAAEQAAMRASAGGAPEPSTPPPPPADVAFKPIRGTYGARVGTTKTTEIRVVDVTKVPLNILNSPRVLDAIVSVARDFAKHADTIDGLEIIRGNKTAIRRK